MPPHSNTTSPQAADEGTERTQKRGRGKRGGLQNETLHASSTNTIAAKSPQPGTGGESNDERQPKKRARKTTSASQDERQAKVPKLEEAARPDEPSPAKEARRTQPQAVPSYSRVDPAVENRHLSAEAENKELKAKIEQLERIIKTPRVTGKNTVGSLLNAVSSRDLKIAQLVIEKGQLNDEIAELTQEKSQLANDNRKLNNDNRQLCNDKKWAEGSKIETLTVERAEALKTANSAYTKLYAAQSEVADLRTKADYWKDKAQQHLSGSQFFCERSLRLRKRLEKRAKGPSYY